MSTTSLALFEVVRGGALSRQPAMVLITVTREIAIMTILTTRSSEMNKAPDINNHLRSIDLFRSIII